MEIILYSISTLFCGIILTIVFAYRSKLKFELFEAYTDRKSYDERLSILALAFALFFPLIEYVTTQVTPFVTPLWEFVIPISLLGTTFFFSTMIKGFPIRLTRVIVIFNSTVLCLFLEYRLYLENFSPIILVQLMTVIVFASIVFSDIKLYTIYWLMAIAGAIMIFQDIEFNNLLQASSLVGIFFALFFSIIFQFFQIGKISKLNFANKILDSYDRLIIVYNSDAEVVYVNPYMADFFQKNEEDFMGYQWYNLRNLSLTKRTKVINSVKQQISSKKPIERLQESLFSKRKIEKRTIDWRFSILDENYLIAIGTDITDIISSIDSKKDQK